MPMLAVPSADHNGAKKTSTPSKIRSTSSNLSQRKRAMTPHILAIDQGTTGSTVLIMDVEGRTLGRATREFAQHFPKPGWVEHEPEEIWQSVRGALAGAFEAAGARQDGAARVGIYH